MATSADAWELQSSLWVFFLILTFAQVGGIDDINIKASDGDMVVCVDKYDQPALYHPLLQNHQIQESPSEIPRARMIGTKEKGEWRASEAHVSKAKCPRGTIPMQNITALDHRAKPERSEYNSSFTPQHEYAEVATDTLQKLYGTIATINVWEPVVENRNNELSLSQVWVTSGDYETKDLNTVEAGWQVCPGLYKDNKPRLFVYWTSDAYHTTGGYNLRKPGFVQTSSEVVLGGAISPVSSIGGRQFEITILVWKDPKSGNWWLSVGPDYALVGYWPRELFTTLADNATLIAWGGEIVDSHNSGRHTKTEMGSGRFPEEGFGNSSYFRNLEVVDNNCTFQLIPPLVTHAEGTYYDVKNLHRDELGTHFFYGGPGYTHELRAHFIYGGPGDAHRHSGVPPLRFSLVFLYFSFSFFIII